MKIMGSSVTTAITPTAISLILNIPILGISISFEKPKAITIRVIYFTILKECVRKKQFGCNESLDPLLLPRFP